MKNNTTGPDDTNAGGDFASAPQKLRDAVNSLVEFLTLVGVPPEILAADDFRFGLAAAVGWVVSNEQLSNLVCILRMRKALETGVAEHGAEMRPETRYLVKTAPVNRSNSN